MLKELSVKLNMEELFKNFESFKPFPTYSDREAWGKIESEVYDYYLNLAEANMGYTWSSLTAAAYLEFHRNGNRVNFEKTYFERRNVLKQLLFAECFEGKGRFIDDIINGVWAICEESTWILPAHIRFINNRLPDVDEEVGFIDLFSAETASLLTWVSYFLKDVLDKESLMIASRIKYEIKNRIITPFMKHDNMGWMGNNGEPVNNWNPWIISNVITVLLCQEDDNRTRVGGVIKCLKILDNFINVQNPDGGCDEGPTYWSAAGASLFDCLELLYEATEGLFNVFHEELIKNLGRYIQRVHIAGDYYVNFADSAPKSGSDYALIARYGRRIQDKTLENFGIAKLATCKYNERSLSAIYRIINNTFAYKDLKDTEVGMHPQTAGDVWFSDLQVMTARENPASFEGFFLAAKGGHNAESHNHNDIGSFIVYYNGLPVIIDPGVESYTAKTFSAERYEIWTMQSSYHNLPEVNGVMQKNGIEYRANNIYYEASDNKVRLQMDISGAYPEIAGILKWDRNIELYRGENARVEISDEFSLKEASENILLNLLTCCECEILNNGEVVFKVQNGDNIRLIYDPEYLCAEIQSIPLMDEKIKKNWELDRLYRIQLKSTKAAKEGRFIMVVL